MKTIELTQGQITIVDDEDYEELSKYKWRASWNTSGHRFYVTRAEYINGKWKTVYMHRQIMGAEHQQEVHHWNDDALDNQRDNLCRCSHSVHLYARKLLAGHSSLFRGVRWSKNVRKWRAEIGFRGKSLSLGYFANERDAALAYDAAAIKYAGKFALTNF